MLSRRVDRARVETLVILLIPEMEIVLSEVSSSLFKLFIVLFIVAEIVCLKVSCIIALTVETIDDGMFLHLRLLLVCCVCI